MSGPEGRTIDELLFCVSPPVHVAEISSRVTTDDLLFARQWFGLPPTEFHFCAMRAVAAISLFSVVLGGTKKILGALRKSIFFVSYSAKY
jgi:hypothetical protein